MTDRLSLSVCVFQDIDEVQVHYPGIIEVMTDLQGRNRQTPPSELFLFPTDVSTAHNNDAFRSPIQIC